MAPLLPNPLAWLSSAGQQVTSTITGFVGKSRYASVSGREEDSSVGSEFTNGVGADGGPPTPATGTKGRRQGKHDLELMKQTSIRSGSAPDLLGFEEDTAAAGRTSHNQRHNYPQPQRHQHNQGADPFGISTAQWNAPAHSTPPHSPAPSSPNMPSPSDAQHPGISVPTSRLRETTIPYSFTSSPLDLDPLSTSTQPSVNTVTDSWDSFTQQHTTSFRPSHPPTTHQHSSPISAVEPDLWDLPPMQHPLSSPNLVNINAESPHPNSTNNPHSSCRNSIPELASSSSSTAQPDNESFSLAGEHNRTGSVETDLLPPRTLHTFDIEPAPARPASANDKRELLIYAIPLHPNELIFLPVCSWKQPVTQFGEGVGGRVQQGFNKFGSTMRSKAAGMWQGMGQEGASVVSKKVYDLGQAVVESVSPEERLLRAIPKDVTKIIIYHPSQIPPDELQKKLAAISSSTGLKSAGKAAVAGLMLPIAFGLDLLVIPGIHVLTAYTAWEVAKDTASALGGARLTRYIGNADGSSGGSGAVRLNYFSDTRLDRYVAVADDSVDGVLSEDEIIAMCEELNQEELLQPLGELRRRHLRKTVTKNKGQTSGAEYTLLKTQGS